MSGSDSDIGKASDSDGPSKPSASRRPKRTAPRQSVVETDSSGSEDNAVKIAKLKAKKPRKSNARDSPSSDEFLKGEDREKPGQLNELDREMLAFERQEEAAVKRKREQLRQSLMSKEKKLGKTSKDSNDEFNQEDYSSSESEGEIREKSTKKPSAEDEDPDLGYHRPSEVNAKRNKRKAMDELVSKRRDKKEAEEKRKEQENNRAVLDIDEIFGGVGARSSSSSSSSSSSRSPSVSSRSRSPSPEQKREIEDLDELNKCKISRTDLAHFVHYPFFNSLAIGCYVRIGIGENNGRPVYRIVEIIDVVETAKVYNVEGKRTNKGLKMRHGADQRVYRLEFISNQAFEQKEWIQWLTSMRSKNVPLPTLDQIERKKKEIERYKNYTLSSIEIDYMVKEKQRFSNAPTNYAMEKNRLMMMKADADEQGNLSRAKEIQREVDELDAKADDIEHTRNQKLSAVALINQKRRNEMKQNFLNPNKINYDPIRQDDPFTRKSNRTKMVSGRNKEEAAEKKLAAAQSSNQEQSSSQASSIGDPKANGTPILMKKFPTLMGSKSGGLNTSRQFAISEIELDLDI